MYVCRYVGMGGEGRGSSHLEMVDDGLALQIYS